MTHQPLPVYELTNAAASCERGRLQAALGQLRAFQNEVRAQSDRAIPTTTATALLDAAQTIIDNTR